MFQWHGMCILCSGWVATINVFVTRQGKQMQIVGPELHTGQVMIYASEAVALVLFFATVFSLQNERQAIS